MIIAIDGPAAAGKSTVAKLVARELGLTFLDTGAMYRAVTLAVLERQRGKAPIETGDEDDEEACAKVARSLHLTFDDQERILIDGKPGEPAIRSDAVTRAVSVVSAHPAVRRVVVPLQREEARRRGGIVAEGRDIGSVVFPAADFKFFLDASPSERARRRALELGAPARYEEILADIVRRDRLDSTRRDSPLVRANGAIVLQTDALDAAGVAAEMLARIRSKHAAR